MNDVHSHSQEVAQTPQGKYMLCMRIYRERQDFIVTELSRIYSFLLYASVCVYVCGRVFVALIQLCEASPIWLPAPAAENVRQLGMLGDF